MSDLVTPRGDEELCNTSQTPSNSFLLLSMRRKVMDLFIGNLPFGTTAADLYAFFRGHGRRARFRIIEKHGYDGGIERFGHGNIEPDKAADRAIQMLHRKRLQGRPLTVREYFHRAYGNERRMPGGVHMPPAGRERRAGDRRRPGNLVEPRTPKVIAHRGRRVPGQRIPD